jgi:hypothetical protein
MRRRRSKHAISLRPLSRSSSDDCRRIVMYSTCLFCHSPLGSNDVLQDLPIGRRVAFDASKGRLWIVCDTCGRWNLTPLEERWEVIEDCERMFRDVSLKVSSDNIGLAGLANGFELVRIGEPVGSELAVWRYGREFAYRRRRFDLIMNATRGVRVALAGSLPVVASFAVSGSLHGGLAVGLGVGAGMGILEAAAVIAWSSRTAVRVHAGDDVLRVRAGDMATAELLPSGDATVDGAHQWMLRVHHVNGIHVLAGEQAWRAAGTLLAMMNWDGARSEHIDAATGLIVEARDPEQLIVQTAARLDADPVEASGAAAPAPEWDAASAWRAFPGAPRASWGRLSSVRLLALEMAIQENVERRALRGELAELEHAWREAEEIAAIADDLLLPAGVEAFLARHRLRPGGREGA